MTSNFTFPKGLAAVATTQLTASAAVALTLLRDGHTAQAIARRTGIAPEDLYQLAAEHDVTAPHGSVEGAQCHLARSEDPCPGCQTAKGRGDARALAKQRLQEAKRKVTHPHHRPSRRRRATARPTQMVSGRPSSDPASSSRSAHVSS